MFKKNWSFKWQIWINSTIVKHFSRFQLHLNNLQGVYDTYHLSIKLQDLILTIILIRNLEIVTIFLCRSFWIFSSPKFGSSYEDCWQTWLKASDISTWLHYQLFNPLPSLPASHKGLSIFFKIPLWQWLTFYLLPNTHFIWLTCFWANSTDLNFLYCFGYLLT